MTSSAVDQWVARSTRPKRTTGEDRSGRTVVPAIRPPDPSVDVVAALLPEPGDHLVGEGDLAEPLAGLVAVHRRYVEPGRSAVGLRQRPAVHLVGDDDVGPPGLVRRERFGVPAVERGEAHGG